MGSEMCIRDRHIARLEGCCENDEVLVVEMVRWDEVKEGEKRRNEAKDS